MPATKRAPIYLDPALHDALLQKAGEAEISDLVNEVVRLSLADYEEEAEDLAELDRLRKEPNIPFEEVVADLKRRGRL
jgi:hypothetical protein